MGFLVAFTVSFHWTEFLLMTFFFLVAVRWGRLPHGCFFGESPPNMGKSIMENWLV
jgi:hypothetical protein